jgi:chromosome segregation ATPase
VSPERERVSVAARALEQALTQVNDVVRKVEAVNAAASAATTAASEAQSLRQERQRVLEDQLRAGGVDHDAPELRDLESRLAQVEAVEKRAAAVSAAHSSVAAGLQEELRDLRDKVPALRTELLLAQFEAAGVEIREVEMPAFRAAAERYAEAWARLAGAGRAHCEMAVDLRGQGVAVQPLGAPQQTRVVRFSPIGFGFADSGGFNSVDVDSGPATDAATAEFLARWRSAD